MRTPITITQLLRVFGKADIPLEPKEVEEEEEEGTEQGEGSIPGIPTTVFPLEAMRAAATEITMATLLRRLGSLPLIVLFLLL